MLKIDKASHKLSFEQYAILINAKQISFHFLHLSPDVKPHLRYQQFFLYYKYFNHIYRIFFDHTTFQIQNWLQAIF